jgi:hypothetical protein
VPKAKSLCVIKVRGPEGFELLDQLTYQ